MPSASIKQRETSIGNEKLQRSYLFFGDRYRFTMQHDYDIEAGDTTILAEEPISGVSYANEVFGRTLKDGSIPVVLVPGAGCCGLGSPFYLTIPEGCYAMVRFWFALLL